VHTPKLVILLVVLLLRVCSPLPLLNSQAVPDGVTITQDLAYEDGPRHRLDVYAPPLSEAHAPVVVFFYGGGWRIGMKQWHRFIGTALASHGMLVIIADYRQYPEVTFPAFMLDAASVVGWARTNATRFGGDPHNLFLMGHSAGGQIVTLLALDPTYLQTVGLTPADLCGVIGLAGAYDLHPADPAEFPAIPAADWAQSRPINHVTSSAPPMLLLAGDADTVIEPGNTLRFADRLRAAGASVTVVEYPEIDHMALMEALALPLTFLAPVRAASLAFIAQHGPCGG
jgi:acetyl esterase/lipase